MESSLTDLRDHPSVDGQYQSKTCCATNKLRNILLVSVFTIAPTNCVGPSRPAKDSIDGPQTNGSAINHTSVRLCLFAYLPACLLACLFAYLLACLLVCLLACLLACLPTCLLVCLFACLFVCLLACLLACLFASILRRAILFFNPFSTGEFLSSWTEENWRKFWFQRDGIFPLLCIYYFLQKLKQFLRCLLQGGVEEGGIFLKSVTPNGAAAQSGKMIVGKIKSELFPEAYWIMTILMKVMCSLAHSDISWRWQTFRN